ncbi:MAG: phospholipid carrier-dependent glycosyltransferase, partial [Proteobacteria bacterium]
MKFTNRATLFGIGALIIGPWLFPSTLAALVNSWWGLPIFLLCFTAFAVGIISWGLLLERRLGGGLVAVAPFGLAACIFFAGIIGHLGGLHLAASLLFPSILLGGFILARKYWCSFLAIRSLKQLCNSSWFAVIFTLAAFIRLYAGFLPEGHGDPLYYHLLGPRLWVEAGKISVNNDLPSAVLAGAWEYLYVWPQVLWRNGGIQGLIAAQIFSQWLHLVFGWLGCSFVIYKMARLLKAEESTAKFMALAALFASSVQWTGGLAKNDLGIAFFALSSIYLMLAWARENQLRCATLASPAFLGGLAVGGKVNALFVMAPFGIIFALSIFNGGSAGRIKGLGCAKVFLALASGVVLGAIPFFLRNYYLTANPFYPLFGAYFPSEVMSQSWLDFVSMLNPNGETDRLAIALRRLRELSKENPMMWGWLLLLALPSRRFRVAIKPFWIPIATAALSFILFALAFVGHIELRHLGAGLVLLSALGALFFWEAS